MQTTTDRRFGWITDGRPMVQSEIWDQPLLETRRFVTLPSLGALVPGWLVVVPRQPMINLSHLSAPAVDELEAIVDAVTTDYRRPANEWYVFEHGPQAEGSLVGCGVDQAHLHLVPLPFDLLDAARSDVDGAVSWSSYREGSFLRALPVQDYIGVSNAKMSQHLIGTMTRATSQWMRKLIARKLESEHRWDYRQHPERENIRVTVTEAKRMLRR